VSIVAFQSAVRRREFEAEENANSKRSVKWKPSLIHAIRIIHVTPAGNKDWCLGKHDKERDEGEFVVVAIPESL
jgi:hypothetical protein